MLAKAVFPKRIQDWGRLPARDHPIGAGGRIRGWRRAFIIAEQHPRWGAEMAAAAGVSQLAASLIRRHQDAPPQDEMTLEHRLLRCLQSADGGL